MQAPLHGRAEDFRTSAPSHLTAATVMLQRRSALGFDPRGALRGETFLAMLERLRPGASPKAKAQAEYRAITAFTLRFSKIDALNEAVSAIAAAAVFEVRSIRYGVKDEERVLDEARRAAVRNARRQAEVYADAAGVQLDDILEMTDGTAGGLGGKQYFHVEAEGLNWQRLFRRDDGSLQ